MINRQEWLKANGFILDPFLLESFHAETDLLLIEDLFVESYVDMDDATLLFGLADIFEDSYIPGSRFIFSKSGGGKTGIIKRIHWENKGVDLFIDKPRVLVIDYADHGYSLKESSISCHINRIISLVTSALDIKKLSDNRKSFNGRSPKLALKRLVTLSEQLGYKGICILVDNIDVESYEKILPLALNTELNKIKGLSIKFFIPEELFFLGQQTLPFREFKPYILQWDEKKLVEVLSQRLSLCLKRELNLRTMLPGISSLCDVDISETIQNYFINVGKLLGPGGMWEFGYYLLEEHTKSSELTTELIGEKAYVYARLRMTESLLKRIAPIDYGLVEYFQDKYEQILKRSVYRDTKAKVFLCCINKDQDDVYRLLYKALESESYKPLMIHLDTLPGENLHSAIDRMIEDAEFFLPCFSVHTLKKKSDKFYYALSLAMEKQREYPGHRIYIIPTLIGRCKLTDYQLKQIRPLELSKKDFFFDLVRALEKGIKPVRNNQL